MPDHRRSRSLHDVRMRGFKDRADVADVLKLLVGRVGHLPSQLVALREAAGRVLAEDVVAQVDVPCFDRSAMDGYAVRGEETFGASPYNPLRLRVVGESLPGRAFPGSVGRGEAVRIMTGAPIPCGADAVLMAENVRCVNDDLEITDAVPPGRNVGRRAEDIVAGTLVLQSGRRLRPQDVGVLSSIGVSEARVYGRPRVVIVITGEELLPAGTRPRGFQIADSNSVMLEALVQRDGGVAQVVGPLPDHRERIREALLTPGADCILVSGGSSVGAEDHAPTLVAELGELAVHGVAMRPSSPAGVGFIQTKGSGIGDQESGAEHPARGGLPSRPPTPDPQPLPADSGPRTPDPRPLTPVFLLPGNPVSCLCAYDFFAGPTLRRMGGRSADWPYRRVTLPLARKISSAVGRVDYVRVRIEEWQVVPIAISGASILSSTTRADGFVLVAKDREGHAAEESVVVYLYD